MGLLAGILNARRTGAFDLSLAGQQVSAASCLFVEG
jgi:hypothetical protein